MDDDDRVLKRMEVEGTKNAHDWRSQSVIDGFDTNLHSEAQRWHDQLEGGSALTIRECVIDHVDACR